MTFDILMVTKTEENLVSNMYINWLGKLPAEVQSHLSINNLLYFIKSIKARLLLQH